MFKLLLSTVLFISYAQANSITIFSANSRRETIAQDAPKAIGFVKIGGCTGYFIKSTDTSRSFISSARHCFKYDAPTWCKTGTAKIHTTGQVLKCLGVAAGDETHDTVLLEFENTIRDRSGDFSYANAIPAKGTRLEMIGYPKDGYLTDRKVDTLITTHNCKVVATSGTNIYTNIPEVINDKVFRHDCSTYGGNSGGPMLIEGTRTVIGIPDQYKPGSTPTSDIENARSIQGVRADSFASDLEHDLTAIGAAVISPVVPTLKNLNYFADGSFTDAKKKKSLKVTETSFLSNTSLISFTLESDKFTCENDTCKSKSSSKVITIVGADLMKIQGESYNRTSVE